MIKEACTLSTNDRASQRLELIRGQLESKLSPSVLEVVDESHLHVGHAGSREGKGHFKVTIIAEKFRGLNPIKQHKLIYAVLAEFMKNDIHALSIDARVP